MGKRKSTKAPPKKQRAKLDTTFNCPFCNASKSVSCQMDHEREVGTLKCNTCTQSFSGNISHLTEPVDIYHDWIDECDKAN